MRTWILSMVGASVLTCVALNLCPEGRVKSVARLLCGIVCALALIKPVMSLDLDGLSVNLAAYRDRAREVTQTAEDEADSMRRTYIQDECAAYISAEAQKLGVSVGEVSVTAIWNQEEAVWVPYWIAVDAPYAAALSRTIEADLGVPAERQEWSGNG